MNQKKHENIPCPNCGGPTQQIRWEIAVGSEDLDKEVEKFVFRCPEDATILIVEIPTGNPSKYAYLDIDEPYE